MFIGFFMNKDQGIAFLQALGAKNIQVSDNWLRAPCMLAPWLHQKGKDTKPSFGLTIDKSKHSTYHCFACQTGSPEELIQALEFHSNYGKAQPGLFHFAKAREILESEKLEVVPLPEYSEFGGQQTKHYKPLPDSVLDGYPLATMTQRGRAYLQYRNIPEALADHLDIRADLPADMLMFPYRDMNGRLAGARGRLMDFGQPTEQLKHFDYTFGGANNAFFCWYNEQCLALPGPVLVVEGQADVARMIPIWPKTVGNMTAKPSARKLQKLAYCDQVILFTDNDDTGRLASDQWAKLLDDLGVQVGVLPWDGAIKSEYHTQRDGPGTPKDPDETDVEWVKSQLPN